jgi:fibronectin-binding autotransporter adhesin
VSPNGSGTNVGSTAAVLGGDFTVKAVEVNPTFSLTGYPTTWQQFTFTLSGLSGSTTGRIGFRYYLSDVSTQGTNIGIDTFSFADPTVFTRTVSGNWTDTTGWTSNAVPNGTTVTAQLVNPGSGTNNVNLGGGTFTVNQLQFSGTNAGTWNVTNGTIVFDGTSPTFLNQGDSNGLVGSLPNLTLNATTTFEIDNASAVTDVTGAVTGTGGLIKTGSGTLMLTATNTYSGGTTISAGTLQIGNGGTSGSITGNVTDNGTLAFDRSDAVTIGVVVSGTGSLMQLGGGTLILTADNTYTGGTIVNAGTLQLGDGTNTTSLAGANGSNGFPGGAGKDAVTVNNSATFNVMTNASVSGGAGGIGAGLTNPGNGGEGVSFSAGGSLTNSGTISGGAGGEGAQIAKGGNGGEAVSFSAGGSLTNSGTISGGAGGTGVGAANGTGGFGSSSAVRRAHSPTKPAASSTAAS